MHFVQLNKFPSIAIELEDMALYDFDLKFGPGAARGRPSKSPNGRDFCDDRHRNLDHPGDEDRDLPIPGVNL